MLSGKISLLHSHGEIITDNSTRFCVELNSARTKQKATIEMFKTVSRYANNVPIVVVGTKKDQFMGVKVAEARREARKNKTEQSLEAFDAYAEAQFRQRMKDIETELLEIDGGRFDATVGVSIGPSPCTRQLSMF